MAVHFVWIRANYYDMIGTRLLIDGSERIDITNWQHGSECYDILYDADSKAS